jgi:hypothetical protein
VVMTANGLLRLFETRLSPWQTTRVHG